MSLETTRKNRNDLLDACVVHRKRIAELEAELAVERDAHHIAVLQVMDRELALTNALKLDDYRLRVIQKTEAELITRTAERDSARADYEVSLTHVQDAFARAEKAEAEVERLTADLETALKIIKGGGRESESLSARKAIRKTRLYNQATDRWEEVG